VSSVEIERSPEGIVTVVLDQQERKNAIDLGMFEELLRIFQEVRQRDEDRVLILTGAGGQFSSGADLSREGAAERHPLMAMQFYGSVAQALHEIPKPTIAKVRGIAAGAGLNLALGCDLIAAAESARFSEIFARRGLTLDVGGSWLLPRLIGMHRAKELALLADVVSAPEAERMGLVNRVVPDDELDAQVDEWAARLAAGPPLALAQTKQLLNKAFSYSLSDALEAEAMAQTVCITSEDAREAMVAFFKKREPDFKGR